MNFKINESAQKLRGGYYTPPDLASYLSNWVAETNPKSILEPSCGDGVFVEALGRIVSKGTTVTAIEVDPTEAQKASCKGEPFENLVVDTQCVDFLEWYLQRPPNAKSYDAVVGNPPFIRYQYLSRSDQDFAELIFRKHSLPFTKHTNAWVPFVIASISLLKPGGRLAMVVPAEILHVLHAQSLRSYAGQHCKRIIIIDPEEIWFDGTLQGAVLFLAEKKLNVSEHTRGLGIIPTTGKTFLASSPSEYFRRTNFINGETVAGKWTRALLTKKELDLFKGVSSDASVHRFSEIADVDVGMVTGANRFFLVNEATVKRHKLSRWSHPMFGRSEHCPGILFNQEQHQKNSNAGLPSHFLWFDVVDHSKLPRHVLEYIRMGEGEQLHTRYKCRIRKPWFKVPSVYATSVGMLKRSHHMPRLIYNEMGAYTTDTAYRIRTAAVDAKKLVYCFVNSLTALSSELEGRHYGGGVLELVPSEIERLFVPIPRKTRTAIRKLDNLVRTIPAREVLVQQDQKILRDIGLSGNEIADIHDSWDRLRRRRHRSTATPSQ